MESKPIKLIATYQRVSTANQEEEETIKNQTNILGEFAEKNNYSIVRDYIDDGWSGDTLIRPALDQLRQDAKEKIWDAVLIYDPDRIARRYSYQELIMDELKEAGVEVIFITVSTPKNSEDKILHGVRGLFAEYERAKITERFRLGKLRKLREGHILVSEPLYGYRYIPKKDKVHGYYEINPDEARIVKMIFEWVANEGMTLRKVVKKLKELGIKPRKSVRGVWNTSTLSTLLRNRALIGEAHWGSSYAVVPENPINKEKYRRMRKSSRRNKPEEEWIADKIPVPKIIDRELFMRARKQLEDNFVLCKRNKKNEYLLSGLIQCVCGKNRTGEGSQHSKHLYYRCTDRVYSFPLPPTCKEGGINARIADKLIWDKISELMSSQGEIMEQAKRWRDLRKNNNTGVAEDVGVIKRELEKLNEQETRYDRAYGAGVFSIEKLKEYTVPIREQVKVLENKMQQILESEDSFADEDLPSDDEISDYVRDSVDILGELNFAVKRGIIMNVVKQVIGSQEELNVRGQLSIISSHVEYKTSHRNCRIAQCGQIHTF